MTTKTASIRGARRYRWLSSVVSSSSEVTTSRCCLAILLLCNACLVQPVDAVLGSGGGAMEYCLQQRQIGSIGSCLGQRALSFMQQFEDMEKVTLFNGSLKIERATKDLDLKTQSRSIVNFLDLNPTDFRGIFEGMSNVMGARSMKWDLDVLFPGLQMRVGPYHGMNSVLEFVMDPEADIDTGRKAFYATESSESPSIGRALTKSFLLPFLLGFKFNLSLVLPLLIGLLLIVGKKIVFISKLVLLLSGVFGWGVPFASHRLGYGQSHHYAHRPLFQDGFYRGGGGSGGGFNDKESGRGNLNIEVTEPPYEFDRFYDYEKKNQKRFDPYGSYENDAYKPRTGDTPIDANFQTSHKTTASKREFAWRPSH